MTKKKQKRMAYLKQTCLDLEGQPLFDADTSQLAELADLAEEESKDIPKPAKAKKDKKDSKAWPTPEAQVLVDQGCKYLGHDGHTEYLYRATQSACLRVGEFEERREALIVKARKVVAVGSTFGAELLARLEK